MDKTWVFFIIVILVGLLKEDGYKIYTVEFQIAITCGPPFAHHMWTTIHPHGLSQGSLPLNVDHYHEVMYDDIMCHHFVTIDLMATFGKETRK